MIKVFKGGYEVAQEYYFNYESYNSDIYDSKTRIITGLLSLKNLTDFQQLAIVNKLEDSNLVIIEPTQSGYMVNLLNVREIEFTKTMSNTESIYRITGSKLMKPKRVSSYKVSTLNGGFGSFMVNSLISVSVDELIAAGNIRMQDGTDIRYLQASDAPLADLKYEIGKCRIETGQDFYITQTGGSSHKMQMPSLSGVPFPNNVIKFLGSTARIKGKRLEMSVVNPNLIEGTAFRDGFGDWKQYPSQDLFEILKDDKTGRGIIHSLPNTRSNQQMFMEPHNNQVESGKEYTVSFKYKSKKWSKNTIISQIRVTNTPTVETPLFNFNVTDDRGYDNYTVLKATFTPTASGYLSFLFYNNDNTGNYEGFYKDVKVEQGNTNTDYIE